MAGSYTIGLDFGTNSVRCLIVEVSTGGELASYVWPYARGVEGIVLDGKDPHLARQHPQDYIDGVQNSIKGALDAAADTNAFEAGKVIGIGIDTTGSTPLPIKKDGTPLALDPQFENNPNAMAWLWKDHTSYAEAEEITALANSIKPNYLAKIGGTYSSEWFWAKILHCRRVAPKVYEQAYTWVEYADWIPALLTGNAAPDRLKRGICAAGHKGLFHSEWSGYPEKDFLKELDPKLVELRGTLPNTAYTVEDSAGVLSADWADRLGLPKGIPVAVGAFDAHLGGIGSGIQPGIMVKNIGTSTCDMMVEPLSTDLPEIPGLCGIVPGSILPGFHGMEAGQSAVGDILNWFVQVIEPGGKDAGSHSALRSLAEKVRPGESGLLSLDWNNGNRTVLVDQRLTGLIVGLTLHSKPYEIYRALIEGTAFGARVIMERFEEYGVEVKRVVNCGGIAMKDPFFMQIYADVMNKRMEISRSAQTGALGSAMAGAVVAGRGNGGYDNFDEAIEKMTGTLDVVYEPQAENVNAYNELFRQYKVLHDAFGTDDYTGKLNRVMKDLLDMQERTRA